MFIVNDIVIYPAHGAAIVEELVEKNVGGKAISFMRLVFLYKDMTILVPVNNMETIGIRMPSDAKTVEEALNELLKKPERQLQSFDFTPSGWNRRSKDYQAKIQCGALLEIAKVYRDLMYVAQQKDLSFGEKALLQSTEELLVQELQVVKKVDKELIVQEIRMPFKQIYLQNKEPRKETHMEFTA